jgi:hypothetical protein
VLFLTLRKLVSVVAEQRSARRPAIRAFTSRGEHGRPWSRPLARVLRS